MKDFGKSDKMIGEKVDKPTLATHSMRMFFFFFNKERYII